jgi:hypothetical protein
MLGVPLNHWGQIRVGYPAPASSPNGAAPVWRISKYRDPDTRQTDQQRDPPQRRAQNLAAQETLSRRIIRAKISNGRMPANVPDNRYQDVGSQEGTNPDACQRGESKIIAASTSLRGDTAILPDHAEGRSLRTAPSRLRFGELMLGYPLS